MIESFSKELSIDNIYSRKRDSLFEYYLEGFGVILERGGELTRESRDLLWRGDQLFQELWEDPGPMYLEECVEIYDPHLGKLSRLYKGDNPNKKECRELATHYIEKFSKSKEISESLIDSTIRVEPLDEHSLYEINSNEDLKCDYLGEVLTWLQNELGKEVKDCDISAYKVSNQARLAPDISSMDIVVTSAINGSKALVSFWEDGEPIIYRVKSSKPEYTKQLVQTPKGLECMLKFIDGYEDADICWRLTNVPSECLIFPSIICDLLSV